MTVPLRLDLVDLVAELTRAHVHREHYQLRRSGTWYGQDHITRVPSLIVQLVGASPSSQAGDDRSGRGYGSRPTARLEALDTLARIDREASRWVKRLGEDDPGDTIACVRLLHGLVAGKDRKTKDAITKDVRSWWTHARIVSGLDSPPWRPDNTCPLCGVKGGLRVKLVDQTGFCTQCLETWPVESIGLLANHIRAENADLDEAGVEAS